MAPLFGIACDKKSHSDLGTNSRKSFRLLPRGQTKDLNSRLSIHNDGQSPTEGTLLAKMGLGLWYGARLTPGSYAAPYQHPGMDHQVASSPVNFIVWEKIGFRFHESSREPSPMVISSNLAPPRSLRPPMDPAHTSTVARSDVLITLYGKNTPIH